MAREVTKLVMLVTQLIIKQTKVLILTLTLMTEVHKGKIYLTEPPTRK